ncbi:MAG: hypothetical protein ACI8TQ_001735, partial [Planctomycetota bacterium]
MIKLSLSAVFVALCLSVMAPAAKSARVVEPSRVATAQEISREDFLKQFHKAMEIKATKELATLARRHQEALLFLIIEYGERISVQTNEKLETDMHAFIRAWKDAFNSDFGNDMYEYFSLMKVQLRGFRGQCKNNFKIIKREYDAAIESKDWKALDAACVRYENLAGEFRKAGDLYYVSECWWRAGLAYVGDYRGKAINREKAGNAFAKCAEARKEAGLEDRRFVEANTSANLYLGQVRKAKVDQETKTKEAADDGFGRSRGGVSLAEEVIRPLSFEFMEDPTAFRRPAYQVTEIQPVWNAFFFGKAGATAEILTFKNGPQGRRLPKGVFVDINRDGKDDVELKVTGNLEPVQFEIGEGDKKRKWGFQTQILGRTGLYQGIEMNFEMSDNALSLYLTTAASMVGDIDGTSIRIIDDNMDGVYGSQPQFMNWFGLTENSLQPEYDTIVVGDAKIAQPWSEYTQVGDKWFQIISDKGGNEIVTSEAKIETGKLKLSFKGAKPSYLIVQGKGSFQFSYFNVLANKKGVEVPAGVYSLFAGELNKGKRDRGMKALILPGTSTPTWTVEPGKTTVMELGAPFSFDYQVEPRATKVTLKGSSVAVVGSAGERYERLWNCAVKPDVMMRKAGTKKSGRSETVDVVIDANEVGQKGFGSTWFPLDLELTKRKSG